MKSASSCYVSAYPNRACLTNLGVRETIEEMAAITYLDEGTVNLIGGCCGNPDHIAAFADLVKSYPQEKAPERKVSMSSQA